MVWYSHLFQNFPQFIEIHTVKVFGIVARPFSYELNKFPCDFTVEVTNKFQGLGLVDRVLKELWTEVCNIVQEVVIKTIPKKKKFKTSKWLAVEVLQKAEKRS